MTGEPQSAAPTPASAMISTVPSVTVTPAGNATGTLVVQSVAAEAAQIEQTRLNNEHKRWKEKIKFCVGVTIYSIGFFIFAGFSIWGDATAIAWARPALAALLGAIPGYMIGKVDKD